MEGKKVLIIVPAYNEEKNLPRLFKNLKGTCPSYDVLVINDCSKDNTALVCKENNIKVINLPVNLGIGGAVQTGYKYAFYNNYDVAVQVDGDGQHDPHYIIELVNYLSDNCNICIGSRFINKEGFQSTIIRRIGIIYFSKLIGIFCKQPVTDPTSGFRAVDKKGIKLFSLEYPDDYPEPESIVTLYKNNLKIKEIPVVMQERKEGKSSITPFKSVYYVIKVSIAIILAGIRTKKIS